MWAHSADRGFRASALRDVWGVSRLLALIGLALMFSVAHHGGMWARR